MSKIKKAKKPATATKKRSKSYSRTKGHTFERTIANNFIALGYPKARRQLEYHIDDAKGCDIQGVYPYLPQCKNTKKFVPLNTIHEVQCERWLGEVPILIAKATTGPVLATMYWDDLQRMIKRLKEYEDREG